MLDELQAIYVIDYLQLTKKDTRKQFPMRFKHIWESDLYNIDMFLCLFKNLVKNSGNEIFNE